MRIAAFQGRCCGGDVQANVAVASDTLREADRVPHAIDLTREAAERVRAELGIDDVGAWVDNDVRSIAVPWWGWHDLGWGALSTQQTLPFGTPDEVRAEARRVRDLMSADGGYILSPAQSIQGDVPVANIEALLEVAREPRGAVRGG